MYLTMREFLEISSGERRTVSQGADDHARTDTQRRQRLFDRADAVLKTLRLDKALAAARSIEELRGIPFNAACAERRSTGAINRSVSSTPWELAANPLTMREGE
jgi:hypothetical protein